MKHTAFITGAGKNIGRAIAHELAKRGMNVVIVGRTDADACHAVAAECGKFGVETLVLMGDVGSRDNCQRWAKEALARFKVIDVLVTNAAARPTVSLIETSDEQWTELLDINLSSCFWLSKAFLPGMIGQGWGRIIGFTGMQAIRGVHKGPVAASKHAQWGLMKSISSEFSSMGITANAISPGPIAADDPAKDPRLGRVPDIVPMARRGTPAEVAVLAGLLASEEGSYMTGQMIAVNGGGTT
jgi:3-oxoacyl-[acyl-carrier protein] reductase